MRHCIYIVLLVLTLSGCVEKEVQLSQGVVAELGQQSIHKAQFSKNGRLLAVLNFNNAVEIWRVDNQQLEFTIPTNEALKDTRHIALSSDSSTLIVANKHEVAIWSLMAKALIGKTTLSGVEPLAVISSIAISSDNNQLLVGMSDGAINMANISTRVNNRFKPHNRPVTHLVFLADNETYLSASEDGRLAVRTIGIVKPNLEQEFAHRITTLAVDAYYHRLFVSDALKTQSIKKLPQFSVTSQLKYMARFKAFREAYFVSDLPLLATSSSKSHLSLWDTESGEELGTWQISTKNPGATILAMHSNENGQLLTLNSDAMLEQWDLKPLSQL